MVLGGVKDYLKNQILLKRFIGFKWWKLIQLNFWPIAAEALGKRKCNECADAIGSILLKHSITIIALCKNSPSPHEIVPKNRSLTLPEY